MRWAIGEISIRCHIGDPNIGPELYPLEVQMPITRSQSGDGDEPFCNTGTGQRVVGEVDQSHPDPDKLAVLHNKDTTASAVGHRRSIDGAGDRHG